jgi:hypothetical protein
MGEKYKHIVVSDFMITNGGWQKELDKIPKGYKLEQIIRLDMFNHCLIIVKSNPTPLNTNIEKDGAKVRIKPVKATP